MSVSKIIDKIQNFDKKAETTTRNSAKESVSVQPPKPPQRLTSRDNENLWLKNRKNPKDISNSSQFSSIGDNCVNHHDDKMVAKQESELDESLKYGPGFVNKLKSRYLSLTLRQATVSKQRPSLQQLRRSTSLNNLLDDEEENHVEEIKCEENGENNEIEVEVAPSNGDGQTMMRVSRSIEKSLNLKRARSVEAILRYDNTAWERDIKEVTIEDKIQSAKERPPTNHPPKRLISLIEDDERPPPGICKQTMRIFEASANKKRNLVTRPISTEIANKVAMFKGNGVNGNGVNGNGVNGNSVNGHKTKTVVSPTPDKFTAPPLKPVASRITPERFVSPPPSTIKATSPLVIQDKISSPPPKVKAPQPDVIPEPRSPIIERFASPPPTEKFTVPTLKPVTPLPDNNSSEKFSSPPPAQKPIISPRKPVTLNNNSTVKTQEKTILPKLDIKIIKNNLETKSNGSWSPPVTAIDSYRNYSSPDTSLASSPNILSPFRNSISPQQPQNETSPVITSLSSKLNNLHMETSTPKSWNIKNNLLNDAAASDKEVAIRSEDEVKKVSFSPKINNNVTKVMEDVKKPTIAPPPPPYSVAIKQQAEEKEAEKPKWSGKKKSWAKGGDESVTNTIVFNFSDRKDVPDYIDNDGLVLRRKRELPKPHESGFVLLGDLTLETSTDPDDAYQMGPPSPCDVEFENANIVPEGKSSIRQRKKEVKFKLQFDDSLTETFEYPSETSLMVDETFGEEDEVDANFYGRSSNSSSKFMNSVPLGSTPFANYQPQKASAATFELGITRTTPSPSSASSDENTFISNPESDSEDYLKPATDEESQRWSSEGTRGTDLLF